jgi:hypothetical protein
MRLCLEPGLKPPPRDTRRINNPVRLHPPIKVRSRRGRCWELDHFYEETCQWGSELLQENAAQGPYEG